MAFSDDRNHFVKIYKEGIWGKKVRSGEGARLCETKYVKQIILNTIQHYNIRSFLDAPCGDCTFMSTIFHYIPNYIGVDIVPDLIRKNRALYPKQTFWVKSAMVDPLPQVDLIFCRDLLVHFNTKQILQTLQNFQKSGSKYLLTTTFRGFPQTELVLKYAGPRRWHPLNLEELLGTQPPNTILGVFSEHHKDWNKNLILLDLTRLVIPSYEELPQYPIFVRKQGKRMNFTIPAAKITKTTHPVAVPKKKPVKGKVNHFKRRLLRRRLRRLRR